jgi:hypothetical protein
MRALAIYPTSFDSLSNHLSRTKLPLRGALRHSQWLTLYLLEHLLTVSPRPAYPLGPAFPCSVEFWMMSIAVPLGMGK